MAEPESCPVKRSNITALSLYSLLGIFAVASVIPVFSVLLKIILNGAGRLDADFLFSVSFSMESGGILAPLAGTLILTLLTLLAAVPLGILSGIYIQEYIQFGAMRRFLELVVINLTGVPSVVYGLFGLGLFVTLLNMGLSMMAGALTMACLTLPLIITVTIQALRSVPDSVREAGLALGAGRFRTVFSVVLPMVVPRILTGIILSTARIAGETAPVLFTAAAYFLPAIAVSLSDQSMLLSYHLYALSTQVANVPESQRYAVALVLILIVLILNLAAALLRYRLGRKFNVREL